MHHQAARQQPREASLRARSLGALLDQDIPPRRPLLGSWLTERHLNMTYAPAGVGKSMFAMACALAIAGGGSFLGWRAPEARRVLIVDGEMDPVDLKERAGLLLDAMPEVDREAARENLRLLARQDQALGVEFPDLAEKEGREVVMTHAQATDAALVILDNFSTLATVEDENAASSFDPVMTLMLELKATGAAVMLVHHARKGAGGEGSYRGTSKMAVVMNSIIALSHPDGVPSRDGAAFSLTWEKFRGLRDDGIAELRAHLPKATQEAPRPTWDFEVTSDDRLDRLVMLVRSYQHARQGDLAATLGVSTGTLSGLKQKAFAAKKITRAEWQECLDTARSIASEETEEEAEGPAAF